MKINVVSVSNLILNVFENHSCKLVRCPLRAALSSCRRLYRPSSGIISKVVGEGWKANDYCWICCVEFGQIVGVTLFLEWWTESIFSYFISRVDWWTECELIGKWRTEWRRIIGRLDIHDTEWLNLNDTTPLTPLYIVACNKWMIVQNFIFSTHKVTTTRKPSWRCQTRAT